MCGDDDEMSSELDTLAGGEVCDIQDENDRFVFLLLGGWAENGWGGGNIGV